MQRVCLAALVLFSVASAAARDDVPDLLENERAFAYAVRGVDPQTLEVRFVVAPGYYLYRDKLGFAVEPGALAGAPALPKGESKHDDFFGTTETYRDTLLVRLRLAEPQPGRSVTVIADSQGCADVGVCYPPQRQKVLVSLPRTGGAPAAFVEAAPQKSRWFR